MAGYAVETSRSAAPFRAIPKAIEALSGGEKCIGVGRERPRSFAQQIEGKAFAPSTPALLEKALSAAWERRADGLPAR